MVISCIYSIVLASDWCVPEVVQIDALDASQVDEKGTVLLDSCERRAATDRAEIVIQDFLVVTIIGELVETS